MTSARNELYPSQKAWQSEEAHDPDETLESDIEHKSMNVSDYTKASTAAATSHRSGFSNGDKPRQEKSFMGKVLNKFFKKQPKDF